MTRLNQPSARRAPFFRPQLRASVVLSALAFTWGCSDDELTLRDSAPITSEDAGGSSPTSTSAPRPSSTIQKTSAPATSTTPNEQDSSTSSSTDSGADADADADAGEPGCGNDELEPDEECDDGNRNDGDGCDRSCKTEAKARCSDGVVGGREQCDDGNREDGDGCDRFCNIENICGDEKVEGEEACDPPGSPQCNDKCQLSICGNEFTDTGEECDPPGIQCTDTCQRPCGDGILDPESCVGPSCEECDDGNERAGDGCSPTCHPEECGNGRVDWNEECDIGMLTGDGASDPRIACTAGCLLRSYCGDGVVGGLEECDPAQLDTLPCSDECLRLPGCGDGILSAGEQCADNNNTPLDGCAADCQGESACGDGILASGTVEHEECDDGNVENADGCSNHCRTELLPLHLSGANLMQDPTFDGTILSGWTAADSTVHATLAEGDFRNSGPSGSLELRLTYPTSGDGPVVSGANSACIALQANTDYAFTAYYYVPAGELGTPGASFFFFDSADCSAPHASAEILTALDTSPNAWHRLSGGFVTPAGTLSVRVRLNVGVADGDSATLRYDEVALGIADPTVYPADCGDGVVNQVSESCDDGNIQPGDGCAADCTDEPACGDGNLDNGEECDDGNVANNDYCSTTCDVSSVCGDNVREGEDEQCDGEANCTHFCTLRGTCGDGDVTVKAGEECDNGSHNGDPGNACTLRCQFTPVCGDHKVATTELCDDGNTESGDGCSEDCVIEPPPPCAAGEIRLSNGTCIVYVPPATAAPATSAPPSASASVTAPSPSTSLSAEPTSSASASASAPPSDAGVVIDP